MTEDNRDIALKEFQKFVETAELPILVYFWSPSSEHCKHQDIIIDQITEEIEGKVGILSINIEQYPSLSEAFQLKTIPAFAIFKEGQMIDGVTGYTPKVIIYSRLGQFFDKPFNTSTTPSGVIPGTLNASCEGI
jgi:thioredoxin 1